MKEVLEVTHLNVKPFIFDSANDLESLQGKCFLFDDFSLGAKGVLRHGHAQVPELEDIFWKHECCQIKFNACGYLCKRQ